MSHPKLKAHPVFGYIDKLQNSLNDLSRSRPRWESDRECTSYLESTIRVVTELKDLLLARSGVGMPISPGCTVTDDLVQLTRDLEFMFLDEYDPDDETHQQAYGRTERMNARLVLLPISNFEESAFTVALLKKV